MAANENQSAMDFARDYLRRNKTATFAEIRDAAEEKKLKLYPISYGRAQVLEGIVKAAKYGSKKAAEKQAAEKGVPRRGPGRPKGSRNHEPRSVSAGLESIEGLVDTIKTLQRERDAAVATLERIRALL